MSNDGLKIEKEFSERYALNIIKYLYPERYKGLEQLKTDKPDLKDTSNLVGVEVSVAADQRFYETLNAYLNKKIKDTTFIEFADASILQLKKESKEEKIEQIKKAFEKKVNKLDAGNYSSCNVLDLFLFSSLSFDINEEDVANLFKTKNKSNFRYIYIMSYKKFYEYSTENNKLTTRNNFDFKKELNKEGFTWL